MEDVGVPTTLKLEPSWCWMVGSRASSRSRKRCAAYSSRLVSEAFSYRTNEGEEPAMQRIPVYVVLPPRLTLLDLAGPMEVLRRANVEQSDLRFDVHYMGASST